MNPTERITRRVEFRDTDAAGIVHFSVYFAMMEEAEHEFLRRRGLSVQTNDDGGPIGWPRVAARCEYLSAARFEDELLIDVVLERLGEKSATYAFAVHCGTRPVARGEMTSVCCRLADGRPPQSIAIPAWIRTKLVGA